MSSSAVMVLSSSFTILIISFFLSSFAGHAARLPSQYSLDVPKEVSMPITESHNITYLQLSAGYYYLLTLYPFGSATWQGECFKNNFGYLTYSQDYLLGDIVIQASNGKSWTCLDYYEFKVGDQTIGRTSIFVGAQYPHETTFDSEDKELRKRIREKGVSVYLYRSAVNVVKELEETPEESTQLKRATSGGVIHNGDVEDLVIAYARNENAAA